MSTRLPNGLRLTAHAPSIYDVTRMVSARVRDLFDELRLHIVAHHVASLLDDPKLRVVELDDHLADRLYGRARCLWLDEQTRRGSSSFFHDPLRFEIVFGEVSDDHGTRRLAYPFAGDRRYREALLELRIGDRPVFVDYGYQNSTDRPEDLSEEQWETRRRDWDVLTNSDDKTTYGTFGHLPLWRLPDSLGGVFDTSMWWVNQVDLNAVLSPESRRKSLLRERAHTAAVAQLNSTGLGEQIELHKIVARVVDAYLDSDEAYALSLPASIPSDLNVLVETLPVAWEAPRELVDRIVSRVDQIRQHG